MAEAMTEVERIWREITGAPPTAADSMVVASVENLINRSQRRHALSSGGLLLVEHLMAALREVSVEFGLDFPGDDCDCGGDCPCHAMQEAKERVGE